MREEAIIKNIRTIIESYDYSLPFSVFLKQYFRKHANMGSRDRKVAREYANSFFRIGKNLLNEKFETRLAAGIFLCVNSPDALSKYILETYSVLSPDQMPQSVEEKLFFIKNHYPAFSIDEIFPMTESISPEIKGDAWQRSLLTQPLTWIRTKKNAFEATIAEFETKQIPFSPDAEVKYALGIPAGISVEETIAISSGNAEIQDLSSQRIREFLKPEKGQWWLDACAGSGGKSLLLLDEEPEINLVANDIRHSISKNYNLRLKRAGFSAPITNVDLSKHQLNETFHGIIADVPCTGSGTWGRNPEWLSKASASQMTDYYIPLQRKIIDNLISSLKPRGLIIYITCSVFFPENEGNIQYFVNELNMEIEDSMYLKGFHKRADTLFVARLHKKL
jgi:16S rRNA (cytosine967-C5)-methyltransferase